MLGDWVIFFLALLLVPVLLLEETITDPGVVGAATVANAVIWVLFALDYAVDLWRARDRGAHVRSHWWDLALLIVSPPLLVPPEAQALRVLRAARLLRVFVARTAPRRADRRALCPLRQCAVRRRCDPRVGARGEPAWEALGSPSSAQRLRRDRGV